MFLSAQFRVHFTAPHISAMAESIVIASNGKKLESMGQADSEVSFSSVFIYI